MSQPTVSVVIPVYNGERYLGEAIESVVVQRGATLEVMVIDDGSTDASAALAGSFGPPVRCRQIPHCGIGGARNAGLRGGHSEFVAFLDADDLWTPNALAELLPALLGSDYDLVFGHARQFVSPELELPTPTPSRYGGELEPGYAAGGALIRRDALNRVGPFHEGLRSGEFIDWMARARELGLRETLIPAHVLSRRIHGSNHGVRRVDARTDYARVMKWALDRRRAAPTEDPEKPGAER
ncbi:MAG: glycosyltransferase family 2 protein [Solirubrobacteraceae bacterium]